MKPDKMLSASLTTSVSAADTWTGWRQVTSSAAALLRWLLPSYVSATCLSFPVCEGRRRPRAPLSSPALLLRAGTWAGSVLRGRRHRTDVGQRSCSTASGLTCLCFSSLALPPEFWPQSWGSEGTFLFALSSHPYFPSCRIRFLFFLFLRVCSPYILLVLSAVH